MSLVGSLEDLGLGDILQIVSLSRKSGVLKLRSRAGEGRIVLRDGKVCAATVKGEPEDLRGILVGSGLVDDSGFDAAVNQSRRAGVPLAAALREAAALAPERIEVLKREHVQCAVVSMFGWRTGEFSFEVGGEIDDREAELLLDRGMNAEFLAIEATRLGDEHAIAAPAAGPGPGAGSEYRGGDVTFSGEDTSMGLTDAHEAFGVAVAQRIDLEPEQAPVAVARPATAAVAPQTARPMSPERPSAPAAAGRLRGPSSVRLIAIDPDLDALEWLKSVLAGLFSRIHIFQKSEDGVARIQQYLGRGETPVVLISSSLVGADDSASGMRGVVALAERLRALAPRMPILVTAEDAEAAQSALTGDAASGVVKRPPPSVQADRAQWSDLEDAGRELRDALEPWVGALEDAEAEHATAPPASTAHAVDLSRLVEVSAQLRDPAGRDVMSLVLDFAAAVFVRVVIFAVRDGIAVGVGQRGLDASGGPGDEELVELRLPAAEVVWFRRAVQERRPLRAPASEAGSCPLVAVLGPAQRREVFVGPIESGGEICALLYADALVGGPPLGDTSAVEVVLHQAGLALDRARLERALADA